MVITMMRAARQLLTVFLVMVALDAVWLSGMSAHSRTVFAAIQHHPLSIRMIPAVIVYLCMGLAVWWFAVQDARSWGEAIGHGAAMGLAMYGTYDMTNLATLSNYPTWYAMADMTWGTILCAITAAAAYGVTVAMG